MKKWSLHIIEILALDKWSFKPIGLLIRGLFKRNTLYQASKCLFNCGVYHVGALFRLFYFTTANFDAICERYLEQCTVLHNALYWKNTNAGANFI